MAGAIFWTTEAVLRSALNEQDEDGCRSDKVNWPTLIRPVMSDAPPFGWRLSDCSSDRD
jgi:hypothetical protein